MKYIKTFSSHVRIVESSDRFDDIKDILFEISEKMISDNTEPELIKRELNDNLLFYKINDTNLDVEELESANSRLKEFGYEIVSTKYNYQDHNSILSIIKSDFFDEDTSWFKKIGICNKYLDMTLNNLSIKIFSFPHEKHIDDIFYVDKISNLPKFFLREVNKVNYIKREIWETLDYIIGAKQLSRYTTDNSEIKSVFNNWLKKAYDISGYTPEGLWTNSSNPIWRTPLL